MSTDTLPYIGWRPMDAIVRAYYERNPHGHWFDADTMRFFNTRLPRYGLQWADGTLTFVTSEKGPDEIRKWSVRILKPDGTIGDDCMGFQGYPDRGRATRAMVRLYSRRCWRHPARARLGVPMSPEHDGGPAPRICDDCHHRASCRFDGIGAQCHCMCHDVGDLAIEWRRIALGYRAHGRRFTSGMMPIHELDALVDALVGEPVPSPAERGAS